MVSDIKLFVNRILLVDYFWFRLRPRRSLGLLNQQQTQPKPASTLTASSLLPW